MNINTRTSKKILPNIYYNFPMSVSLSVHLFEPYLLLHFSMDFKTIHKFGIPMAGGSDQKKKTSVCSSPSMFVCPTIMFFHSSMFVLPRILRNILGTSYSWRAKKMPPKAAVLRVSKKCQHVKKGKKILPAFLLE